MKHCDVAIIGAGPYGLSLAAHLRAQGVDFRIFGKAMDTWRSHMPKNMMLKSEGFASNLSAPDAHSTLKSFCLSHSVPYADRGLPIKLADFIAYADWFRTRHVPNLEESQVSSLERAGKHFLLELESGERLSAGKVVLAVGVSWYSHIPAELSHLPSEMVSHSYDHRTVDQFKGQEVIVLGAGASAINLAYELDQAESKVCLLARRDQIEYNSPPVKNAKSLWYQLSNPPSPIGQGWRSYFCAKLPHIFHRLPEPLRARAVKSHVHAAGGWYMREKVEGRVPHVLGNRLMGSSVKNGRVELRLVGRADEPSVLTCDHVIAATGYRVDVRRLKFLSDDLQNEIAGQQNDTDVSANFETSVPGLYAVGMTAMKNFGPVLRFMVGTEFTAPHLARHLSRRIAVGNAAVPLINAVILLLEKLRFRASKSLSPSSIKSA